MDSCIFQSKANFSAFEFREQSVQSDKLLLNLRRKKQQSHTWICWWYVHLLEYPALCTGEYNRNTRAKNERGIKQGYN